MSKKRVTVKPTKKINDQLVRKLKQARSIKEFVQPVLATHDRLTVLTTIHHEHHGEAPVTAEIKGSILLDTQIEPYKRRVTIPPKDTPLDIGWVTDAGYVVIDNRAGVGALVESDEEEKERLKKQLLLVRFKGSKKGIKIRPGLGQWFELEPGAQVILRAADKEVPVNLTIYPR